uniref:Uncharacterized protein n=1 Tax=Arundo donax TaxID=35708 RepID=A0A0A8ZFR3_ARUDO
MHLTFPIKFQFYYTTCFNLIESIESHSREANRP